MKQYKSRAHTALAKLRRCKPETQLHTFNLAVIHHYLHAHMSCLMLLTESTPTSSNLHGDSQYSRRMIHDQIPATSAVTQVLGCLDTV